MMMRDGVKKLNEGICMDSGSTYGVRSEAILEEALRKPSPEECAKWIAQQHPFFDGNKRTAILFLALEKGWFGFDPEIVKRQIVMKNIMDVLSVT